MEKQCDGKTISMYEAVSDWDARNGSKINTIYREPASPEKISTDYQTDFDLLNEFSEAFSPLDEPFRQEPGNPRFSGG